MIMMGDILWFLGVGISVISLFTIFEPRWQLKLMKILKIKPVEKRTPFIQRLGILKLAIGIALMAVAMVF
jgi:hypothetical protein